MQDTVRVDRNKYIGGSDIPAVMNISPFKTRWQLLREKVGLEEDTFEGNEYTKYGQEMERKILAYINETMGRNFVEGKHYNKLTVGGLELDDIEARCHTDGEDNDTIVEIKTTSQVHDKIEEYKVYLVQVLYYMYQAKKPNGILAVYERPKAFSLEGNLEFDPKRLQIFKFTVADFYELTAQVLDAVEKFLVDRKKLMENPFLTEQDLMPVDLIKSADAVLVLEQKIAEYKKIEKEFEKQKESLLKAMMDAGTKTLETVNGYKITVVDAIPSTVVEDVVFDTEAFNKEHPRLFKKFSKSVSKTKSGKKAYLLITSPKGGK